MSHNKFADFNAVRCCSPTCGNGVAREANQPNNDKFDIQPWLCSIEHNARLAFKTHWNG
jgi:hypothetical protein